MKKLIIAEKPSVAKTIAHTVGAYEKVLSDSGKFCAYSNDEYYVANAVGHLYGLGSPADYGYSDKWADSYNNGELPMFPAFKNLPANDDKGELRDFLNALINHDDVDEIICATDAAREGELIFREIYAASGSNKPCKRFWTSSLTEEAVKTALGNMKPLSEYDNLYRTAKVRNELDWIFGMNLSRNYSVLDSGCTHRVGRVITPLLGIIAERDREIEDFKQTVSYKLVLNGFAESEIAYESREQAESKAAESTGQIFTVKSKETESKSENRPKLFSLTRLQQEANNRYGLAADATLNIAQELYEKKLTTYPRTDSEVISEDMRGTMSEIAEMLSSLPQYSEQAYEVLDKGLNLDKRIVNNAELTDHHAIIPTNQKPNLSSLSENAARVYDLIANRTLMALNQKYEYNETKYVLSCAGVTYTATAKIPVSMGWKKWAYKKDEAVADVPDLAEGEAYPSENVAVKECKTQPPKRFTDASLLSVMENIHNRMDDEGLKEAVKKYGIGTSATRAEAIKKLIDTGYAARENKNIISTEFGRDFVDSLPKQVLSVERTAEWEQCFNEIEKGADETKLYEDTKAFVENIIEYEKTNTGRKKVVNKNAKSRFETVTVGKCPRCGMDVIEKKDFYGCSSYKGADDKGCGFSFRKAHRNGWYEGEITPKEAEKLLSGKTITLKAVSMKGEKYDCQWKLEDDGQYVNVVKVPKTANVVGKCPRCGMDVKESKMTFSCSSYKSADDKGCGFAIWKEDKHGGFTVTAKMAKELLSKGETTVKIKTMKGETEQKIKLVEKEVNGKKYVNLDKIN